MRTSRSWTPITALYLQEQAKALRRRQIRHILFTEPDTLRAGQEARIFYNPASTVLNGRSEVYVRGGFNR